MGVLVRVRWGWDAENRSTTAGENTSFTSYCSHPLNSRYIPLPLLREKPPANLPALELPRQQVAQPALDQRHHPAEEEDPHPPPGGPEAAPGALTHRPRVEPVVDQVLQVLLVAYAGERKGEPAPKKDEIR